MIHNQLLRRRFLRDTAFALGAASMPFGAFAQVTLLKRPEWQVFKTTPQYKSLLNAITLMKANTNSGDPKSWGYWTNIHVNRCPHGVSYFLAWHRGYLYYFERQLRAVSGDANLVLPYWDYYSYATIPSEFTDPSNGNPLYVDRMNTSVRQALTLAPFASTIINFPRGMNLAFEPSVESGPHNPVHDIIGNAMATMQSPVDPIFWLHHANVDRLWVAWVSGGGGRNMPSKTASYWSGNFSYSSSFAMKKSATYSTRDNLGYYYQNEVMPTALPIAQATHARVRRAQATRDETLQVPPPLGSFQITGPRPTSDTTFSVGGALNVGLSETSISVQLPIGSGYGVVLSEIARGNPASIPSGGQKYRSIHVVLDDVALTEKGKKGGYFYQIYLNVPSANGSPSAVTAVLIGTLGPFQIQGALHHSGGIAKLRYPLGRALAPASTLEISMLSVSFVRVNGDNSVAGGVIGIGETRLELSTEEVAS